MNERDGGDALLKLAGEITGEASLLRYSDSVPTTIKDRTSSLAGTIAAAIDGRIRALCGGATARSDVAPAATEIKGEVGDRFERTGPFSTGAIFEVKIVHETGLRVMTGCAENGGEWVAHLLDLRNPDLFRFVSSPADRIKGDVGDRFQAMGNGEPSGIDVDVAEILADGRRILVERGFGGALYRYTLASLRDPALFRFISSVADRAKPVAIEEYRVTGDASGIPIGSVGKVECRSRYLGDDCDIVSIVGPGWRWSGSSERLKDARWFTRLDAVAPVEMAVHAPDSAAEGVEFGDMFECIDGQYKGLGVGIFCGLDSGNDLLVAFGDGIRAWVTIDELTGGSVWRRRGRLASATKMIDAVDRFTRAWAAFSVEDGATFEQVDTAARELSELAGFKVPFIRKHVAPTLRVETPGLVHVQSPDGDATMCTILTSLVTVAVVDWREKSTCHACRIACGSLPRGGR